MLLLNNPSIDVHHDLGGENSKDFEVDPTVIDSYAKVFGMRNKDKVMMLLYAYPKKFDRDPKPYIQPKIEKLKWSGLKPQEILDICASNIKVISSRQNKYWRQVEILIELGMPPKELYALLCRRPKKKEFKTSIKGII